MDWKWLLTPAEPRGRYALLLCVGTMLMLALTYPLWQPGGRGMAAFATVLAVVLSHVSAKFLMRR